jgi:signal transduction histidine kinase/CheY-like chemotaxis protein
MKSAVQILITRLGNEYGFDSVKVFQFDNNNSSFTQSWIWQAAGQTALENAGEARQSNYSVLITASDKNQFDSIMHGTDYIIIDSPTAGYPSFLIGGLNVTGLKASAVIPCPAGETFIGCAAFEGDTDTVEKADFEQLKSIVKLLTAFMAKQRSTRESRAKSEFLSKMSHEIRTPMNAILGMTEIALSEEDISTNQAGYLKKIKYSAKYLLTLINDILDMSRIESGKSYIEMTDINLDDVLLGLQSIIGTQCEAKGLFYIVSDRVKLRRFVTDILKLNQILLNLLGNAVKFTPPGGRITLDVSLSEPDKDDTAVMTFIVSDTGIGIRKDRLQKIFEPFEQEDISTVRQYGGTGLGLPISRNYVNLLGGDMNVESEQEAGTTFTFTIPVKVQTAGTDSRTDQTDRDISFDGRHILIAEDDELNMEIAQTLLTKSGFDVTPAENGRIAVEAFANSAPGFFDAILLDIRMPELNGLEAAEQIRAMDRPDAASIPILALSANAFAEDIKISKAAGMNDHIIKPLDMRILLQKLKQYMK